MPEVLPPVPDPARPPKPAEEMARDGEQEGEVLVEGDHSQSAPESDGASPPAPTIPAPNGD